LTAVQNKSLKGSVKSRLCSTVSDSHHYITYFVDFCNYFTGRRPWTSIQIFLKYLRCIFLNF